MGKAPRDLPAKVPQSSTDRDRYLTQQFEKNDKRKWQREKSVDVVKTLCTAFTFASCYPPNSLDTAVSDQNLKDHYEKMQNYKNKNPTAHITRTFDLIEPTSREQPKFSYGCHKLTNETFGSFEAAKFTTRATLKEQKKYGGACLEALTSPTKEVNNSANSLNKKRGSRLKSKTQEDALYTMSDADLRNYRIKLLSEQSSLSSDIAQKSDERTIASNIVEMKKYKLEQYNEKRRPIALRDGQVFGDASLHEIHRVRQKATAMQKRKEIGDKREKRVERVIVLTQTTKRSVESDFNSWKACL
ncbi:hypothetical protein ScalyP_jg879 [Parmales sp. scaly parma]|nr:hypothetical protein ScalyP_jg879 [Parmales sp. scaly parma]